MAISGKYQAAPETVTDGKEVEILTDASGRIQTVLAAGSASIGTVDTELPAAAALADNTANPTAPAVGAHALVWDGATWDRAPGDSTNGLDVDVTRIAAGENHLGEVGGRIATPSANFTRPADTTAYASGDLVANSTTAGSVTALSWTAARVAAGSFLVRRIRLRKSGTSTTNASFRVHLYTSAPTPANGDNGAWSTNQVANYLGSVDVTVDKAFTDGAQGIGTPGAGSEISVALASGQTIYGLVEARAAYTPASAEVFECILEVFQN